MAISSNTNKREIGERDGSTSSRDSTNHHDTLTVVLFINFLNTVSAMQITVAVQNVRFISVDTEKEINGETKVIKKTKAILPIKGEGYKYVTKEGKEVDSKELSFFADNMWRMMYEKGAGAYLDHIENSAKDKGISLDTAYGALLTHFTYTVNIEQGKVDLLEMVPDETVEKGIAKYSKVVDDILG